MSNPQSLGQRVRESLGNAVQYAKDVATLQVAKENFFKDSGTFDQWFAHGANEAANMVLHGHPAPIYGGASSSPAQVENSGPVAAVEPIDVEPVGPPELNRTGQEKGSVLSSLMQQAEQMQDIEMVEPEMEQ